jgi:pimeloyl-ACP methyl ester carboxylesterase
MEGTMFTEHIFDCGGQRLNYAAGPTHGPPLLLLHGVTRRWQDYVPLFPVFHTRWQILALDWRGHGRSGRAPGHYHVADYVNDALAFVRAHVDEPVVIYGHSLGALAACGVAALAPERVRAVVLEDPPAAALIRGIRQTPFHAFFSGMQKLAGNAMTVAERTRALAEMLLPGAPNQPAVPLGDLRDATSLRFSARCLQDLDPEVLTPLLEVRWLDGYDQPTVMAGVRCPALLLRADDSYGGMMPLGDVTPLITAMADCTVIDLRQVGHAVHWLEREKTIRFVVGFLESLR